MMITMDDLVCKEYEDFRTHRDEDMLAESFGWMFLSWIKTLDTALLVEQVRTDTEKCLVDIVAILDREELSDFQCVDEIIDRLEKLGLGTSRHDFG